MYLIKDLNCSQKFQLDIINKKFMYNKVENISESIIWFNLFLFFINFRINKIYEDG